MQHVLSLIIEGVVLRVQSFRAQKDPHVQQAIAYAHVYAKKLYQMHYPYGSVDSVSVTVLARQKPIVGGATAYDHYQVVVLYGGLRDRLLRIEFELHRPLRGGWRMCHTVCELPGKIPRGVSYDMFGEQIIVLAPDQQKYLVSTNESGMVKEFPVTTLVHFFWTRDGPPSSFHIEGLV